MEVRLTDDLQELIRHASDITGRSVTDFVLSAATAAAYETIERAHVIQMSLAEQDRFAQALLAPPAPNKALVRAFKRRRELTGET